MRKYITELIFLTARSLLNHIYREQSHTLLHANNVLENENAFYYLWVFFLSLRN